ncbi:MAG: cytochrome c [Acidobacteria bacterium]|nr:MAG: cytochrome c [Acidobacteriota bacterium]
MRLTAFTFVFATAVGVVAAQGTDNAARAPRTVWDGVYSAAQAERGEESYRISCATCHRDDLSGYNSLLLGERFMEKYREASLQLFFDKTKTTMPRNAAGSLSDDTYVDIVSYVLKMNEFPAGARDLGVADIASVRLVGKGGPEPVPNFSLVQVVGCLTQRSHAWIVTNATEPVRTGSPQPEAGEVVASEAVPSGTGTFELLSSAAYTPSKFAGRIVEVRGFLIRRPTDSRINVTSLETAGPECAPAGGQ